MKPDSSQLHGGGRTWGATRAIVVFGLALVLLIGSLSWIGAEGHSGADDESLPRAVGDQPSVDDEELAFVGDVSTRRGAPAGDASSFADAAAGSSTTEGLGALAYDEQVAIDQFVREVGNDLGDDASWYLEHPSLNPDGATVSPQVAQRIVERLAVATAERDQLGDQATSIATDVVKQRMDDGLENDELWPEGANRRGDWLVNTSITHYGRRFKYSVFLGDHPDFDALWEVRAESMRNANRDIALLVFSEL